MTKGKRQKKSTDDQVRQINVAQLVFDPNNPRLPSDIANGSDEDIIKYMLDQESLVDLMRSIAEIGFFPGEPLLVFPHPDRNDIYIVGEGNRRLAALKLLEDPNLARVKLRTVTEIADNKKYQVQSVPVIIYQRRMDFLNYLGYRHITGVEEWDPLSKARYIKQLYDLNEEPTHQAKTRSIARTVGSNFPTVNKILHGVAVIDRMIDLNIINEDFPESKIDFSVLTTALGYQHIGEFIGVNNDNPFDEDSINNANLTEFTEWALRKEGAGRQARTRIGESRNLSALNAILGAEEGQYAALESFRRGATIDEAVALTTFPSLGLRAMLEEIINKIRLSTDEVQRIKIVEPENAETGLYIFRLARNLQSAIENRLKEGKEE